MSLTAAVGTFTLYFSTAGAQLRRLERSPRTKRLMMPQTWVPYSRQCAARPPLRKAIDFPRVCRTRPTFVTAAAAAAASTSHAPAWLRLLEVYLGPAARTTHTDPETHWPLATRSTLIRPRAAAAAAAAKRVMEIWDLKGWDQKQLQRLKHAWVEMWTNSTV